MYNPLKPRLGRNIYVYMHTNTRIRIPKLSNCWVSVNVNDTFEIKIIIKRFLGQSGHHRWQTLFFKVYRERERER
jgi:hypothetical protein